MGRGLTAPAGGDMVAVLEIDRAAAPNNAQAVDAAIRLTATDGNGNRAVEDITFSVTDQDLDITSPAVSISGNAREDGRLTATFDHTLDPDLASGARPEAVVFSWYTVDSGNVETLVQQGPGNTLALDQEHVGDSIRVKVTYAEVSPAGAFDVKAPITETTATTADPVANAPDPGAASFVLRTDGTKLVADVAILDEDGWPSVGTGAPAYTWEKSPNGVGNWSVADAERSTPATPNWTWARRGVMAITTAWSSPIPITAVPANVSPAKRSAPGSSPRSLRPASPDRRPWAERFPWTPAPVRCSGKAKWTPMAFPVRATNTGGTSPAPRAT